MDFGKTPTQAVVERVAAAEGVDPLELQPPLFDAIDADAMDSLFESANSATKLQFTYHGYNVTIDGDYNVELDSVSYDHEAEEVRSLGRL